jgi:EAL domain-containing protein (putative c-di-GMP-specific phosphodiesterase class I)
MVPVLRGMGCAEGQGYHFGRPLDEATLLAEWSMHHGGAKADE